MSAQVSALHLGVAEAEGVAFITVSLPAALPIAVGLTYATVDGTALAGSDYVFTAGVLTFNPGETEKVIVVPIVEDGTPEPDEWFFVHIGQPDPALAGMMSAQFLPLGAQMAADAMSLQSAPPIVVRVLIAGTHRLYLPIARRAM